jgi:hypothetical protein
MARRKIGRIIDDVIDNAVPTNSAPNVASGGNGGNAESNGEPVSGDSGGSDAGADAGAEAEFIAGYETFDPAGESRGSPAAGSSETGRRGRKKRSDAGTFRTPRSGKGDITGVEGMLNGIHWMLSRFVQELELDDDETAKLARAVARVTDLYDHKMNPAVLAWGNLAVVAGGIYGPRAVAYMARTRKERRGKLVDIKVAPAAPAAFAGAEPRGGERREPEPGVITNPAQLYGDGRNGDLGESA